ncbi:unnamed protein product [Caenorhabditis angaria]|uniref:Uncharacterized protein n=1 Tax=Caenorhabditis angaria TaxID=860376 RepID=A0A9P1IX53_9PELO|nr:unnamed protein product [Caenorhabditis angaria]
MPRRARNNAAITRLYGLAKRGSLEQRIRLLEELLKHPQHYGETIRYEIYHIFSNNRLTEDLRRIAAKNQDVGYDTSRFLVGKYNSNPIAVIDCMCRMQRAMRRRTAEKRTKYNFQAIEKELRDITEHDDIKVSRLSFMKVQERNEYFIRKPRNDHMEVIFMAYLKTINLYLFTANDLLTHREDFLKNLGVSANNR